MFILTEATINAIKSSMDLRADLTKALQTSATSIYRFYSTNEPNNDLTKYAALVVLKKYTGWDEKKILREVSSKEVVTAK